MELLKTPILAFVVNTRCPMKCKKCSLQIPKHPQRDYDLNLLIKTIDAAFQIYDFVQEVRINGGEPMLHQELDRVIAHICDCYGKQFGKIMIPTSASHIPAENLFKAISKYGDRIYIRVDDYGKLSIKLNEVLNNLKKWNITFDLRHYHGENKNFNDWFDYNDDFSELPYSEKQLEKLFTVCRDMIWSPHCWEGKLWACCFEASGVLLGRIPYSHENGEYISAVDLLSDEPIEEKRRKVELIDKKPLEGCKYCFGLDKEHGRRVPAAEQIV